jgi:hypothetical protein
MQTILIYGASSSGSKTTLCGEFAKYQYEKLGVPTLYCGSDSGWEQVQDEVVEPGYMLPFNLQSAVTPVWALRRITRGYWPAGMDKTGISRATDKEMVDISKLFPVGPRGYRIGGLIIEGLTRNAQLITTTLINEVDVETGEPTMSRFRLQSDGTIIKPQGKGDFAGPCRDEEESFGMNSRGTFSNVQQQTLDYVNRLKGHPYAPRIVVTAHQGEGKTSGDGGSSRCLGPVIMGRAGVGECPGWFSSYFHTEALPANSLGWNNPEMRRLWFTFHPDQNGSGLMWPGKLGGGNRLLAHFRQVYPEGYIPIGVGPDGSLMNIAKMPDGSISWLQGGLAPFLQATGVAPGGVA